MESHEKRRPWSGGTSRPTIGRKRRRTLTVLALAIGLTMVVGLARSGASWGATTPVELRPKQSVIVRAVPGGGPAARRAVVSLGGTVGLRLSIINGFAAKLPAARVDQLRRLRFIRSVTADRNLRSLGADYEGVSASDVGTMANVTRITGAVEYWKAGYTGKGVDVALIDTGVAPVDGLRIPGKVVNGPDLSFDSQKAATRYVDGSGHGTHLAGIIAGRADGADPATYADDKHSFLGMAPDARIVNVKVGDAKGVVDVSQVIAAVDWVVQHRNDAGLDIRVLNLSYGTDTSQDYVVDPLAFAVEQAVRAGIVVVVAAGNAGYNRAGTMQSPASSPFALAVGATDSRDTMTRADDVVASFSSLGSSGRGGFRERAPDLLAPGAHIVSLRVPGSTADVEHPAGRVSDALFRGSGTSQAAAVVSGAAALVIQQRPTITPVQLAKLLSRSATDLAGVTPGLHGADQLDLALALDARTPRLASIYATPSKGGGSLEQARGSAHVTKGGVELSGDRDIFGMPYVSAEMAKLQATGSSWSGGIWNGSSWSGSSWSGSSWSGSSWSGSSWSGSSWSGSSWSGSSWSASSWSGSSWSSACWSSASWLSTGWLGASWG